MLKEIGAAIADARRQRALGVGDLGVESVVVERIEAGLPGLTTTQLQAIASALGLDEGALRDGRIVARPRPSVFLRHRGLLQDFAASDGQALDDALDHARTRNALAQMIGEDAGLFPKGAFAKQPLAGGASSAEAAQGYKLAQELRRRLDLETPPLGDLCKLAEQTCGIAVLVRRLATIGSTAFAVKAGNAAAIVLSATTAAAREPFARAGIAHELCHVLFDPDDGEISLVIEIDDDRRAQQAERRARAFAAELLLPRLGLRRLLGEPTATSSDDAARELVTRARAEFGATWQITANHLCNCGFVAMELREWLERQQIPALASPWRTTLPAVGAPSLQVEDLTRRAHEAGHLTDGEAREILQIDCMEPLPWDRE